MEAENRRGGESSAYRGVRKRKWGKWVSEVREPGKKTRIWLGSFETPEMAAMAHDTAVFYLRGQAAQLNFPHLVQHLPRPASSSPDDIRLAAQEASLMMARNNGGGDHGGGGCGAGGSCSMDNGGGCGAGGSCSMDNGGGCGAGGSCSMDNSGGPAAVRVGLSPAQLQAIHEVPLDSPDYKMWTDSGGMVHHQGFSIYDPPPSDFEGFYEEVPDDNLWD